MESLTNFITKLGVVMCGQPGTSHTDDGQIQ